MRKALFIFCILPTLTFNASQEVIVPQAVISNTLIKATLYLPDTINGYYRGSRFDWSGVISSLEFSGHNYFGQWFEKYNPTTHDAVMGPVDDFTQIGYSDAKPGETFLKIGIGMVAKPEERQFSFAKFYKIVNSGKREIKIKSDRIQFFHILKDNNYAYEYTKSVSLIKGKPVMVLSHTFRNTGKKPIETLVYNHNFFVMDNQPVGPGYAAIFPFKPSATFQNGPDNAEISGNRIILKKNLLKGETIYCGDIKGFGPSAKDYDFRIENHKSGAGVRITCDRPLARIVFWACPTAFCPEPYITIKAEPGKEFTWNIRYEFYNCEID